MRKFFGFATAILFLSLMGGVSWAQHGHMSSPHVSAPHAPVAHAPAAPQHNAPQGTYRAPAQNYRGGRAPSVGYHNWYGARPEYRRFGWGHYYGWHYRPYLYLGSSYCYTGVWGAPYFTFGFNAARWRVVDFDFAVVSGWYPGSCAYVVTDPYHDGWYLIYDQTTGEYVHAELW